MANNLQNNITHIKSGFDREEVQTLLEAISLFRKYRIYIEKQSPAEMFCFQIQTQHWIQIRFQFRFRF